MALAWRFPMADSVFARSLLRMIRTTKITDGHDNIIAAIDQRFGHNFGDLEDEVRATKESLLAQKQAAEVAAVDLHQSFPYDGKERALMIVIEKITEVLLNVKVFHCQGLTLTIRHPKPRRFAKRRTGAGLFSFLDNYIH
ncbi:MAG: hypothetical protein HYT46_00765 [Candidatus Vogelbacteria bacterium]|nr:hypothetical protein [Candidatus Vogelbacteria bacterium]